MAITESDIIRDEQERSSLQRTVADLETAMITSNPAPKFMLELALAGLKAKVSMLDKKIEEAKIERAAEVQAQAAAAAALAARETGLNEAEREIYRGFLEESYFTRKDLGKLDAFYTQSYDRLSAGGKEEMSERLHEGLRRGEFKFSDLSQAIQQRENAHCSAKAADDAPARQQIFRAEDKPSQTLEFATKTTIRNMDLGSVDLSGVKLADATRSPAVSELPDASGSKINQR